MCERHSEQHCDPRRGRGVGVVTEFCAAPLVEGRPRLVARRAGARRDRRKPRRDEAASAAESTVAASTVAVSVVAGSAIAESGLAGAGDRRSGDRGGEATRVAGASCARRDVRLARASAAASGAADADRERPAGTLISCGRHRKKPGFAS